MNLLSINIHKLSSNDKHSFLKKLCQLHEVNFWGIQETKISRLQVFFVRGLWSNMFFLWIHVLERNQEEYYMFGITKFPKNNNQCSENKIDIDGIWLYNNMKVLIVNVMQSI